MPQIINYKPKTEEELLGIATNRVTPSYDEQLAIYQRQTAKREGELKGQMSGLDDVYARLGRETEGLYEQKRQGISDTAMARGFGRSSYVTDMMAQSHDQQIGALNELTRRKGEEFDALGAQIEGLYDQLFENEAQLSSQKQQRILSTIDQLRMEQDAREMEVAKYNSDIELRIQQMMQDQEKFETQMAYNRDKLAADTSYRESQMKAKQDEFAYRQAMDALARQTAAAEAAAKAAAAAAKTGSRAGSSSTGKSKTSTGSKGSAAYGGIGKIRY